jgi:hypothetical protein
MRAIFEAVAVGVLGFMAAGAGAQQAEPMGAMPMRHEMKPVKPTGPLTVSFADKKAEWPLEKLAALPHTAVTVFNEHTKKNETYSGVLLMDLLAQVGMPAKPHGKDLKLYVVVAGADGYKAVYAGAEATPDLHEATILVADAQDGKPLGDDGPLKLVATGEKRPARWVRNLASIEVRAAD